MLTDEILRKHPLSVWTELAIGLEDEQELKRKKPIDFGEAVALLSKDSGVESETCRSSLETFLTRISLPETERGGLGTGAFLAFKFHQCISGAGEVFTTLTEKPRDVLFEGQLEDPSAPGHRLYPTRFCRECGPDFGLVARHHPRWRRRLSGNRHAAVHDVDVGSRGPPVQPRCARG